MKRADGVFALICLGLSFWLVIESFKYDYMTTYTPGPGFHPFWLGICLGLLSLFLLVDTLRRGAKSGAQVLGRKPLLRAGAILLTTAGLVLLMTRIGFVPAVFLFIVLVLVTLEKFSVVKGLLYGVLLSGAVFLIFRYWLNVDLPKGWLGL